MKEDIQSILYSEEQLADKVRQLGREISRDYAGKNPLLVSVLKGSVVFMSDLMRAIDIPCQIDFMMVSSYGSGVKTTGVVKIMKDLDTPLEGRDLIIVEDILDSGKTLHYLKGMLLDRHPKSIRIVTLLDKPDRRGAGCGGLQRFCGTGSVHCRIRSGLCGKIQKPALYRRVKAGDLYQIALLSKKDKE